MDGRSASDPPAGQDTLKTVTIVTIVTIVTVLAKPNVVLMSYGSF